MAVEDKNHYELLGVSRDASEDQIKFAYRDLVRIYHPDSNFYSDIIDIPPNDRDKKILEMITLAYDTLLNPDKRKEYDSVLSSMEAMNNLSWDVDRRKDPLDKEKSIGTASPAAFSIASKEVTSSSKPFVNRKFGKPEGQHRLSKAHEEPQSIADLFGTRRNWIDWALIFVGVGLPIICLIALVVLWK